MWIEKTPNGKYKYCERYTDPVTGKARKITVTLDSGGRKAQKLALEILREKMEPPETSGVKLSELIDRYILEQMQTVKMSTYTRNENVLKSVLAILGDIDADRLTAGYIRRKFLDSGKSNTTLNQYLVRYKAMMRWAYRYDYVQDIRSLDKLEPFPEAPERQKVADKYLEKDELDALLHAMEKPLWHDLTAFLALSGLRFGEAAALTRQDADVANRVIRVTKTYDVNHNVTTAPKTYGSVRDVYMQDELLSLCKRVLNVIQMSGLLFSSGGKHVSYEAYHKYLKAKALEAVGRPVTPHVLRHTHASLLMEQGVDIDAISARLGHSDSRVTRDIYLHVTKKLEDERNRQIKDICIIG